MPENIRPIPRTDNDILIQRIPHGHEIKAFTSIFEHTQGDPGRLEELIILILCAQYPDWQPWRSRELLPDVIHQPITSLIRRKERHPQKPDQMTPQKINDSIDRALKRINRSLSLINTERRRGEIMDWSSLVPELTKEIICRDWMYLVDEKDEEGKLIGRGKPGLKKDQPYDPNLDNWFSFIAYYALWKDKDGNRRKTGFNAYDKMYEAIGNYLEQIDTIDLGIDTSYQDSHGNSDGQSIEDKLMETITEYNKRQTALGHPEHCVWEKRVKEYNDGEDIIELFI